MLCKSNVQKFVQISVSKLIDDICPGRKLQKDIGDAVTSFRRAPVALSVDFSNMFQQVEPQEKDRPCHRFLWRNFDTSREPDVY